MILLDTDVISNLYTSGELGRLLRCFRGEVAVTAEVLWEIGQWPDEGATASEILEDAVENRMLEKKLLQGREFRLYSALRTRLGRGEAATISIAAHRGYRVATDDQAARRQCERQNPRVEAVQTERLLEMAVARGHLTRVEAEDIWKRTGIRDPNRGLR
jgi:predicted nucleic acid-binding protein